MPALRVHYPAAALCVAAAMLAGCGGSQPLIGNPGAMPQGRAIAQKATHAKFWMLPEARHEDLLYVSDWGCCVRVFSYPKGKPVGVLLDVSPRLQGECSDKAGNVWVTSFGVSEILEFAHGGTSPIAVLTEDRNTDPWGCSVDPITGNLAVTNTNSTIAIFPQAQGTPTIYSDDFDYCAYDADGNLFADQTYPKGLFELPRAGSGFTQVSLNMDFAPFSMQWDGENLAIIGARFKGTKKLLSLNRVHVSGTTGTIVGKAILRNSPSYTSFNWQFWVQGSTIMGPGPSPNNQTSLFNFWPYPTGGRPKKSISVTEYPGDGAPGFTGATVSVAPK
jgi:hypothetical protein